MGKKSRMKGERQAAPAKPVNVVANLFQAQDEDTIRTGYQELADALKLEQKMIAIDRANNALLGDPINVHKIDLTFKPIEELLESMERTGENDVNNNGTVLFYDKADRCWYPLVKGLTSMCDTFARLASEFKWVDMTDGLRKMAAKLDVQMPLFQSDLDNARASVAWMRQHIGLITPQQFSAEAIEIQIREELAAMRVA